VATVQYLLAAIGAATVTILLWKAFGPQRPDTDRRPLLAPDDDPEFLRGLNGKQQKPDDDG
jgi:hypothetical protein